MGGAAAEVREREVAPSHQRGTRDTTRNIHTTYGGGTACIAFTLPDGPIRLAGDDVAPRSLAAACSAASWRRYRYRYGNTVTMAAGSYSTALRYAMPPHLSSFVRAEQCESESRETKDHQMHVLVHHVCMYISLLYAYYI